MRRRRSIAGEVRACTPEDQDPFPHVEGKGGGWFISLTWNYDAPVTMTWRELRRLLSSARGVVAIARRWASDELRLFERSRRDVDEKIQARVIFRDYRRWRTRRRSRPRQSARGRMA